MKITESKYINSVLNILMEYRIMQKCLKKYLTRKLGKNLFLIKQNGFWTVVTIYCN